LDNNIHPDKLLANETLNTERSIQASVDNKTTLPVGQLLQNTIKSLPQEGLDSINVVKAMQSLKGLFPSEFTQIQLQDRQAQIDNPQVKTTTFTPISETTKNAWFNGQVIHAKVVNTNNDGTATLLINKQTIEVKIDSNSQIKLETGQNLALTVEKNTNQNLKLVLSTPPEQSAKLIQLIQTMVAKQQAMPPLLASLDSVSQHVNPNTAAFSKPVSNSTIAQTETTTTSTTNAKTDVLPEAVVKGIQQLLSQFSTTQQLSLSEGLKQAINNSGIFLENRIQFQKTDHSVLNNLLSTSIEKIEITSQQFSKQINQKISLPAEVIQTLDKNLQAISQTNIDLKAEQNQPGRTEILSLISNIKQLVDKNHIPIDAKQITNNQAKLNSNQINQLISDIKQILNESQKISIPAEVSEKLQQPSINSKDVIRSLIPLKEQLESKTGHLDRANLKQLSNLLKVISQEIIESARPIIKPEILNQLQKPLTSSPNSLLPRFELILQILENKNTNNLFIAGQLQFKQLIHNKLIQNLAPQLPQFLTSPFTQTSTSQQQLSQFLQQPASISNTTDIIKLLNQPSLLKGATQSIPMHQMLNNINQAFTNSVNSGNLTQSLQQINNQPANLNTLLSEFNLINHHVEKSTSQQNTYPKSYLQSVNQVLSLISKQFNENNQALLTNNSPSFTQSQATQFSQQMQQISQTLSQAISNSNTQTIVNPQIQNDLKLNIHRLLSILQNSISSESSQTQIANNQSKLNSALLQHLTHQESEPNRQALPTRHKHAQVAMAQQNQLLQIVNPLVFQHTLIEQLEGVMSRIVATQAAIREQADSNVNMALEIPFKFQDKSQVLQLKFSSEDKHDNESKEKIWTANLAFELQSLGAIRIYLVLDGKEVSMQFWTEKQSTQQLFAENLLHLKNRLKIAGYHIKDINVSQGVPEEASEEVNSSKEGVIDERV
jgi:Flagellar hook-length control protein FliK